MRGGEEEVGLKWVWVVRGTELLLRPEVPRWPVLVGDEGLREGQARMEDNALQLTCCIDRAGDIRWERVDICGPRSRATIARDYLGRALA